MKKMIVLILFLITGICFTSCGSVVKSSEADITTFTLDGIVGDAVIDQEARTIAATVEPMALNGITPTVTVSEGAAVDTVALLDGTAVTFTVTAEDGTVEEWTITVTAQYGVCFDIDGEESVFVHGLINDDPETNELYGDDTPVGCLIGPTTFKVYAFETATNMPLPAAPDSYFVMVFEGTSTGTYTEADGSGFGIAVDGFEYEDGDVLISVTEYGAVGEDIAGTFSGTLFDDTGVLTDEFILSNGFFKTKRITDYTLE